MTQIKKLEPNELNKEVKKYIKFDGQFTRGGKLYVQITCPLCEKTREIAVALVRHRKKTFRAICQFCTRPAYRDARLLKLEEVRPEIAEYVNLESQALKRLYNEKRKIFYNSLFIDVTCKKCKEIRQVLVSSVRAVSHIFTTLCLSCSRSGENAPNWNGGRYQQAGNGYVMIKIYDTHPYYYMVKSMITTNNTILEHRLVMAQKLGRPLERWEEVHHINSNRSDNRPENLELVDKRQHHIITIAETEVKKLREENKILKQQVKELESLLIENNEW